MTPTKNGIYLTLAYEWIGFENDKPPRPSSSLRQFDTKTGWERKIHDEFAQLEIAHWVRFDAEYQIGNAE